MAKPRSGRQSLFIGRDVSWLSFNRRVLEEAADKDNPILERVKFLSITASNLDEFVEIRVAGLMQTIEDGYNEPGFEGLTPQQTLSIVVREMHRVAREQSRLWNQDLRPGLMKTGVRVLDWDEIGEEARQAAELYYQREVDPLLTPVTIDPAHPFPRVLNKALCLALLLRRKRRGTSEPVLGVLTIPRALSRLTPIPSPSGTLDFLFLQTLIEQHLAGMYRGFRILSHAAFRVTRNSNLYFEEEESRSLLDSVRLELHNRRKGDAVRLEIEEDANEEIVSRLKTNFELDEPQVFRVGSPVNLSRLIGLYQAADRPSLKYKPFVPRQIRLHKESEDLFAELRRHDLLLHHPFDSFEGVMHFVELGARDPRVVSMNQTLYRTSSDSAMFEALIEAAQTKEVTVVVELMARFDEASNIRWARNLEDAGVQVFHGIVGLKTHAKLALLVRRDPDGVTRRYAHLGTGNYNPNTARFYTDISLLTADPEITSAVHDVFHYLTARSEAESYDPLLVAPITLAEKFTRMIQREAEHAAHGRCGRIIAKMNSLLDQGTIQALYDASQAGVEIDLIVRGICSLRPGIPGVSDRIRVRSIVGRFLEHSRIFYFANGGQEEIYCGSADWMSRNLFERCEVVFPVRDPELRNRLKNEILAAYLSDRAKARLETTRGAYIRAARATGAGRRKLFSAQDFFIRLAEGHDVSDNLPIQSAACLKLRS